MTIEERRIHLICNYIGGCVNGASDIYRYGIMPSKVISGARETYANYSSDETVICIVDTTIFGGGQRGMLFTDKKVYYRGMFGSPMIWSYSNISLQFTDELPNDTYFNRNNLKKLLAYLYDLIWAGIREIALADTGFHIIEQAKEIISASVDMLGESENIDQEVLGNAIWELTVDTLEFLCFSDNWLKELAHVFQITDSDEIKSMVVSFDRFFENIDLETWFTWLFNVDILINSVIISIESDRVKAELSDSFEKLIDKMEDAVNGYYDGVPLIDIVCNLKEFIDAFVVEVEYDMETVQSLLDN